MSASTGVGIDVGKEPDQAVLSIWKGRACGKSTSGLATILQTMADDLRRDLMVDWQWQRDFVMRGSSGSTFPALKPRSPGATTEAVLRDFQALCAARADLLRRLNGTWSVPPQMVLRQGPSPGRSTVWDAFQHHMNYAMVLYRRDRYAVMVPWAERWIIDNFDSWRETCRTT